MTTKALIDILIICISGVGAGFIGAQVGGGGLITVPILLLMGLPSPIAVATNRFSALFLNLSASLQYIRHKKLNLKFLLPLALIIMAGAAVGANIILHIDEILLKKVIAFSLLFLLVFTLYKKELGLEDRKLHLKHGHLVLLSIMVGIIGIYGGLIGIAATSFLSFLFIFFGQSFTQSMGYALSLSVFFSMAASVVYIWGDMILYHLAIPQAISVSLGAWLGSKFAIKKGNRWVRYLFILLMLVFVVKLLTEVYL